MKTFVDIENAFRLFLPSVIEFVDGNDFRWKYLNRKYEAILRERKAKHDRDGQLIIEACFLDIFTKAQLKEEAPTRLLDFFDTLFKNLNSILDSNEKRILKTKLYDLLINFDLKYLNFIGEFAAINKLLMNGSYKLIDTEVKIFSGKTIDFKLKDIKNKTDILIEVMNMHLKEEHTDNVDVEKFLSHRYNQKLIQKNGDDFQKVNFFLLPVLWGQYSDLKPYIDFYKQSDKTPNLILEPMAYVTLTDNFGNMTHKFRVVRDL